MGGGGGGREKSESGELSIVSYHGELITVELLKNLETSRFGMQNLEISRFGMQNLKISRFVMQNLEISISISLELGQTMVFISPISPKITEKKEREEGTGSESERKKDQQQSLVFIVWLEIVFDQEKNKPKETRRRLLR